MGWISNIRKSSCRSRDWKNKYEIQCRKTERLERKLRNMRDYINDIFKEGKSV